MKSLAFLAAIMAVFLAVSAQAGEAVVSDSKTVAPAPPPPPELLGPVFIWGWTWARTFIKTVVQTNILPTMLNYLTLSPNNEVGFYGGIKAGYVFGTGVFRPTIEGDFFYNGWQGGGIALLELLMGR